MPKHRRFKLLLDEGLSPKNKYPILNNRHNVKHLKHDLKQGGIEDIPVYKLATNEKRLIITFNLKHYKPMAQKNKQTGVIGLSPHLVLDDYIDSRVNALLSKKISSQLYGHFNLIKHQKEIVE